MLLLLLRCFLLIYCFLAFVLYFVYHFVGPPNAMHAYVQPAQATTVQAATDAFGSLGLDWKKAAKVSQALTLTSCGSCIKSSYLPQKLATNICSTFALDAQWQPGGALASICTASCWSVGISNGVRYHNRNQKADRARVRSTSPTSPPKSRGASRWSSHTASPSISPNYARSSQEQQELRKVLREAGCGPYAPIMMAQGATLPMLATLELRDYIAIFRTQLCK